VSSQLSIVSVSELRESISLPTYAEELFARLFVRVILEFNGTMEAPSAPVDIFATINDQSDTSIKCFVLAVINRKR
jgi:hypothetical protein